MLIVCGQMQQLRKLLDKKIFHGKTALMMGKRFLKFGSAEHILNIKARSGAL